MTWDKFITVFASGEADQDFSYSVDNRQVLNNNRALLKAFADELKARLGVVSDTDILAKHINQLLTEAGVER